MGPCVWSTHSLLQAAVFPDLCGEQGKEKSNNSTRCGIPPSVLEGVREPGKMSGLIFVPFFFFLMLFQFGSSGCVFGPWLVLKKETQKIPVKEKILNHREICPAHIMRSEVWRSPV